MVVVFEEVVVMGAVVVERVAMLATEVDEVSESASRLRFLVSAAAADAVVVEDGGVVTEVVEVEVEGVELVFFDEALFFACDGSASCSSSVSCCCFCFLPGLPVCCCCLMSFFACCCRRRAVARLTASFSQRTVA